MLQVATTYDVLAQLVDSEEVVLAGRRIRFCRIADRQALDLAVRALQPEGHDDAGLALRLVTLADRHAEVLVYVAEGVVRVDLEAEALLPNETHAQYLARVYSAAELHAQGERAGQLYAAWPNAATSRACTDIWDAVMLQAA